MIKNRQKTIYKTSIFLSLFFLVTAIFFMNNFSKFRDFAGAVIMVSFLISLTFFICIFIFKKRSDSIEYAIQNKKFLEKWSFSKEEWTKFKNIDFMKQKIENAAKFKLLSIITTIVFVVFIFFIKEAKIAMSIVMILLIFMYYLLAFVFPIIFFLLRKKQDMEIMFMEKGVLIGKVYHTWDFPLSKLKKVSLKKDPIDYLEITYSFVDRLGPREYNLRLPIKTKVKALSLIKKLKKANNIK